MKLKKEYVILALLVVGLCLYLYFQKTNRTHYRMPDIPQIDGKGVSRIEIKSPDATVFLTKADDKWTIGEKAYPADPDKVKRMIEDVEKMSVTALVSESKNYFRYDLNDEKKISIKMWTGKELCRSFDLGKTAPTYQHTFIKLADNPNVYHARGNFRNTFDLTIDDMRDKTALSFDPSIIWKIGITKDGQKMIATQKPIPATEKDNQQTAKTDSQKGKEEMVWQTQDGKPLDKSKINRLLDSLSKLKCREYITGREKTDFKDPIWAISLEGLTKHSLSIFPKGSKDAKNHPAVSSGNDYPFELSDYTRKNITSVMEELMKAAADKELETKPAGPSPGVKKKQ